MTEDQMKMLKDADERSERFKILNCPLMEQALRRADFIVSRTPEMAEEVKAMHARVCLIYFEQLMVVTEKAKAIFEKQ